MPDGEPLLVAWATLRRTDVITEPVDTPAWRNVKPSKSYAWDGTELTEEPEPLDVTIDVGVPQVTIVDLMGNKRAVDCPDGKLQLAVDDYPQYIFGASRKILDVAAKYRYPRFPQEATLTAARLCRRSCRRPESIRGAKTSTIKKISQPIWSWDRRRNSQCGSPISLRSQSKGKSPWSYPPAGRASLRR